MIVTQAFRFVVVTVFVNAFDICCVKMNKCDLFVIGTIWFYLPGGILTIQWGELTKVSSKRHVCLRLKSRKLWLKLCWALPVRLLAKPKSDRSKLGLVSGFFVDC